MKPFREFAFDYMEQLQHALDHLDLTKVQEAVELISKCRGTIWLIGNGGSAALASHMATDLQLAKVRAVPLTDVAAITTYSNDSHFHDSFAFQINRLFRPDDILIAISGSGNSANITYAAATVQRHGGKVIGITGWDGGFLKGCCDIHLNVPSDHMGRAQDGHQVALHIICYYLMERGKLQ